jgi:hypothetical protein
MVLHRCKMLCPKMGPDRFRGKDGGSDKESPGHRNPRERRWCASQLSRCPSLSTCLSLRKGGRAGTGGGGGTAEADVRFIVVYLADNTAPAVGHARARPAVGHRRNALFVETKLCKASHPAKLTGRRRSSGVRAAAPSFRRCSQQASGAGRCCPRWPICACAATVACNTSPHPRGVSGGGGGRGEGLRLRR